MDQRERGEGPDDRERGDAGAHRDARRGARRAGRSDHGSGGGLGRAPFGTANVSLLVRLLCSPHAQVGWTPARRRAHARALVDLATDHWFTDDELEAIERALG